MNTLIFIFVVVIILLGLMVFIILKKRNENKCKHENLEKNALLWDGVDKEGKSIYGEVRKCLDCGEKISKTAGIKTSLKIVHPDDVKMDEINKNNQTPGGCQHINFETQGLWDGKSNDGKPMGGPVIKCLDCGNKEYMTWEIFKSVPRNAKDLL
jgi:hypothetical protein